jgi:hypothetical protein
VTGWLWKVLETPELAAERKAGEAQQRRDWAEIKAIEVWRSKLLWRTWADT